MICARGASHPRKGGCESLRLFMCCRRGGNSLGLIARAVCCADLQCLPLHQVRQLKKMAATDEALQRSLVLEIEELKRLKALLPHSTSDEPNRKRRKHSNSDAQT